MNALFANEELMNIWVHALLLTRWLKLNGESPLIDLNHDVMIRSRRRATSHGRKVMLLGQERPCAVRR
jgi:hypothetical protein